MHARVHTQQAQNCRCMCYDGLTHGPCVPPFRMAAITAKTLQRLARKHARVRNSAICMCLPLLTLELLIRPARLSVTASTAEQLKLLTPSSLYFTTGSPSSRLHKLPQHPHPAAQSVGDDHTSYPFSPEQLSRSLRKFKDARTAVLCFP